MHSVTSGNPPITRHPLFPATVALWFGAVFGIGSLAIRPALLESALVALKIDAVLPGAVPLGPTARILIALALAGIGGLLGAALARRIARPRPVVRQRKRGAVPAGRIADGGEHSTASKEPETPAARVGRRSQLAFRDDSPGSAEHLDRAPVPGAAQILDVSQFGLEGFEPEPKPRQPFDDAASPGDLPTDDVPEDAGLALPGYAASDLPATSQPDDFEATAGRAREANELPRLAGARDRGDASSSERDGTRRSLFERQANPGLFAQPLNAQVSEIRWQESSAGDDAFRKPEMRPEQPETTCPSQENDGRSAQAESAGDASAAERIVSADLGDLSPLELLERLAISLRRKRERMQAAADLTDAAVTSSDPDSQAAPEPEDDGLSTTTPSDEIDAYSSSSVDEPIAADAHQPEEPAPAPFAPPASAIPAALRPVGLDADDEDDALPGFVPPRHIGDSMPTASASATSSGESSQTTTEDLDQGYSSLLSLSRPAQRFVRIEEPESPAGGIEPVVVFPGQEPEGAGPFSRPAESAPPRQDGAASAPDATDGEEDQRPAAAEDARERERNADDQPPPFAPPAQYRDPEETERALRSALANIQRMSGAA